MQMDGYWGVNTTRALQQYLNSQIQAHLNKGSQQQASHQSPMRTFVDDSKTAIGGAITHITGSSHSPSVAKVGQAAAAVASRSFRTSVPNSLSVDGAFSKRTISALQVPKPASVLRRRTHSLINSLCIFCWKKTIRTLHQGRWSTKRTSYGRPRVHSGNRICARICE